MIFRLGLERPVETVCLVWRYLDRHRRFLLKAHYIAVFSTPVRDLNTGRDTAGFTNNANAAAYI